MRSLLDLDSSFFDAAFYAVRGRYVIPEEPSEESALPSDQISSGQTGSGQKTSGKAIDPAEIPSEKAPVPKERTKSIGSGEARAALRKIAHRKENEPFFWNLKSEGALENGSGSVMRSFMEEDRIAYRTEEEELQMLKARPGNLSGLIYSMPMSRSALRISAGLSDDVLDQELRYLWGGGYILKYMLAGYSDLYSAAEKGIASVEDPACPSLFPSWKYNPNGLRMTTLSRCEFLKYLLCGSISTRCKAVLPNYLCLTAHTETSFIHSYRRDAARSRRQAGIPDILILASVVTDRSQDYHEWLTAIKSMLLQKAHYDVSVVLAQSLCARQGCGKDLSEGV